MPKKRATRIIRQTQLGFVLGQLTGKFTLAFYIGMGKDKGFKERMISIGIAMRTCSKMTHVEMVFPDGWSYSSSGMDGGVRKKIITYSHPERWVFVTLVHNMTPESALYVKECKKRWDKILGKKYDHLGIWLNEAIPLGIEDKGAWYCSEGCKYSAGWEKPWAISPARLHKEAVVRTLEGRVR